MASDPLRVDLTLPRSLPDQDRRAAALVALLALEGPLPRSRMAGLLWPDVLEATARNNLSQTLRRLRQGHQFGVTGERLLHLLTPLSEADALALLSRHDYGDLTDLSDLLLALQERRLTARLRDMRVELLRAQEAGELQAALDLTTVLLDLDPLNETTHRTAMQLSHLLGDRAGALSAYHHCQTTLKRELGLSPSDETVALAREIERSSPPLRPELKALPVSVQRPPHLIGRADAWAAMQRAWDAGQGIILSGEPGIGKTRLMRDFAAAHGRVAFFSGRPGDRLVSYSTHARNYRELLRQFPDLSLPDWVRRELARIVPELGEAPPPLASDADKLRFYQAKTETLLLAAAAGMQVLAFDDLQYVDEASVEAGEHSLSVFWGDGPGGGEAHLRTIHAYRSGELSAELEGRIEVLVSAGLAVRIRLGPLQPAQAAELLESLEVTELAGHEAEIAEASGGNPLFALETARHLLTSGDRRALPLQLAALMSRRLERLSPEAVSLARAAAILGPDLSAEAAATMLGSEALGLGAAWSELEAAQVLRGRAFIHDLLREGVLAALPQALEMLLHRRAAAALESSGQAPARIAEHWEAAGVPERAAAWWHRAGDEAREKYRVKEAAALYEHAWKASRQPDQAFQAGFSLAQLLGEGEPDARTQEVVARLLIEARTPTEQAAAHTVLCQLLGLQGEGVALERAAQTGLKWAAQAPGRVWEVELLSYLGAGLFFQSRLEEALETFRQTAKLAEERDNLIELGVALDNTATILGHLNRRQEALKPLRQVERRLGRAGHVHAQAAVLVGLGNIDRFCGRQRLAKQSLDAAWALLEHSDGSEYVKLLCLLSQISCARLLEEYSLAFDLCEQALALGREASVMRPLLLKERAHLYLLLGADHEARRCFAQLRGEGSFPDVVNVQLRTLEALLEARQGKNAAFVLSALMQEAQERRAPLSDRVALVLTLAPWQPPELRLELTEALPAETLKAELFGLRLAVLVCRAQAHLALGQVQEADLAFAEALAAPEDVIPACSQAEVLYTQARILTAQASPEATAIQEQARAALSRVADERIPTEHRTSFLALPLHRMILEAPANAAFWQPLTEGQWKVVQPLLTPPVTGTGRPRRDTRAVLDGVLWALATGAAWNRPFPAHLPSAATCYRRFREWQASGALEQVRSHLGL